MEKSGEAAKPVGGRWGKEKAMDDAGLDKNLSLAGQEIFITFWEQLSDFDMTDADVAEVLADEWGCSYHSALWWRVPAARRVIRAGRAKEALLRLSRSHRLPWDMAEKALEVAKGLEEAGE